MTWDVAAAIRKLEIRKMPATIGTCGRCYGEIPRTEKRRSYVVEQGKLVEIHLRCKSEASSLPNVFRELGFPDAKRDRSQPGYSWY